MKIQELLDKIDRNKKLIESHGEFDPEVLKKINYKFRLDWNYYSNKMEGGTLTKEETRSVMVGNITVGGKPIKDVLEMKGHDNVVFDILKMGKGELNFSEKRVKEIHSSVMHEDDPEKRNQIGEWKNAPNEIINYKGEKYSFVPPELVADKMHELINGINADFEKSKSGPKTAKHPLILATDFHLEYVSIHPFYDGNGRTCRVFTNLILIRCGFPPVIIKDKDKNSYYQILADIQAYGGDRSLFYEFMAANVIECQQLILDALGGKDIEESDDLDKRISILKRKIEADAKPKVRKNTDSIAWVISQVAFPLFEKIESKCHEFDALFSIHSCIGQFSDSKNHVYQIKDPNSTWKRASETWLGAQFIPQQGDANNIQFEYRWEGFKKSTFGDSDICRVHIYFSDYYYEIITASQNRGSGVSMSYGELLSENQIKSILNQVIVPVIEQIERRIEQR